MRIFCGIDNGTTGSIGIIKENGDYDFYLTPIKNEQSYTKTKQKITRIDFNGFCKILEKYINDDDNIKVMIERPMVNPMRFKSSSSALRALESTLIAIEKYDLSYEYVDSKQWQKLLLPGGLKGDELKKASLDIGSRIFPKVKHLFVNDADGMLITEFLRRNNTGIR
jgi:hypothetical protein